MLNLVIMSLFEFYYKSTSTDRCQPHFLMLYLLFVLGLTAVHQNGLSMNQMLMGLSPNVLPGPKEGDLAGHDMGHESKRIHIEKGNL